MKDKQIKEIEQLFLEFFPLYYKKFSAIFRENTEPGFRCTKNQKRAILLIRNNAGITSTELGQCMDMRKGSLTTLLDSLEEMGLVQRNPDDLDRRRVLLSLTPAGDAYFAEMMTRHEKLFMELFCKLSDTELEECLHGLQKVVGAIKKI